MECSLQLAWIFGDHMVLCRDRNIRVFEEAADGRKVTVHINDHTASCTAVKGNFDTVLPPMRPEGPIR